MGEREDLERLRLRAGEFRVVPAPGDVPGAARFLGRVTTAAGQIAVGSYLQVSPVDPFFPESEGQSGTLSPGAPVSQAVLLLGPGLPATGDYLVCVRDGHRWVADCPGSARPVDPCQNCAGQFPATFNLLDSQYGASTLALSQFGDWRGPGSAPNVVGVTLTRCFNSVYTTSAFTAPITYVLFCLNGKLQLNPTVPVCNGNVGGVFSSWPTDSGAGAGASRFPPTTLARVDVSACAHLDCTFNVSNVWTISGVAWNPGGLYSNGATIRVWHP